MGGTHKPAYTFCLSNFLLAGVCQFKTTQAPPAHTYNSVCPSTAEVDAPDVPLATCNLVGPLFSAATLDPSSGPGSALESCCAHSLAACALHRTAAGWGVTFMAAPLPYDSWARCLPEMRACLQRLPGFPADRLSDAPAPSFQVLPEGCFGTPLTLYQAGPQAILGA